MEDEIRQRLIGQDEALLAVARAIRKVKEWYEGPQKAGWKLSCFLAPRESERQKMARSLAEFMFGSDECHDKA